MRVEFLKNTEPYQAGDVIDVGDDRGDDLIRQGLAKRVENTTAVKVQAEEKHEEKTSPQIEHKAVEGSENK